MSAGSFPTQVLDRKVLREHGLIQAPAIKRFARSEGMRRLAPRHRPMGLTFRERVLIGRDSPRRRKKPNGAAPRGPSPFGSFSRPTRICTSRSPLHDIHARASCGGASGPNNAISWGNGPSRARSSARPGSSASSAWPDPWHRALRCGADGPRPRPPDTCRTRTSRPDRNAAH